MARPEYLSLSKRIIDRLSVDDKDAVFWDRDLPGFGIRVYPSGAKVYVVQTRVFGRSKRVTVGRHGELSTDQARKEAAQIIARIKAGESAPLTPARRTNPAMQIVGFCRFEDRDPFPSEGLRLRREFGRIIGDELPVPRVVGRPGTTTTFESWQSGIATHPHGGHVPSHENLRCLDRKERCAVFRRPGASTKKAPRLGTRFRKGCNASKWKYRNVPIGAKVEGQQPPWMKSAHKEQMPASGPFWHCDRH